MWCWIKIKATLTTELTWAGSEAVEILKYAEIAELKFANEIRKKKLKQILIYGGFNRAETIS